MSTWDSLWTNARIATMVPAGEDPYGAVADSAIAVDGGDIAWVGSTAELDRSQVPGCARARRRPFVDYAGLIDCHTHIVYGGNRAAEFEQRLDGATYEEIARAGGGIVSTVRATRQASVDALVESALPRVRSLLREGVTTIEIKSGYGLDAATERRMLQAARRLPDHLPVDVATTFLGAHALPPEYAGNADGYIDLVCGEMIPTVAEAGEADAVDAFCESIGFTRAQTERVFRAAHDHRLPVKLHAEQLSDLGRRGAGGGIRWPVGRSSGILSARTACALWRVPGQWRSCCPAPSISSARRSCRRSTCSAGTASPSRWRPTAIRAARLSPPCF